MDAQLYYRKETVPAQCRPQFPSHNSFSRGRGIPIAPDTTERATTTLTSSRIPSSSENKHAFPPGNSSAVRPGAGGPTALVTLLSQQQDVSYKKEHQRAETSSQSHHDHTSPPISQGEQQQSSGNLTFNPVYVPWRCHRRSTEPFPGKISSEDPQPQWRILGLSRSTNPSNSPPTSTISNASPPPLHPRERCYGSSSNNPHSLTPSCQLQRRRHSTPLCPFVRQLLPGRQLEEEEGATAARAATTTALDIAPKAGTGCWGRAPARERLGTTKKGERTLVTDKGAKGCYDYYRQITSTRTTTDSLPVAVHVDSPNTRLTAEIFSWLLQKDSRAAAVLNLAFPVFRSSLLRQREKQYRRQPNPAHELETQPPHRLQQHYKSLQQQQQQQCRLQWPHWQQHQEGMKLPEPLTQTKTRDLKQLGSKVEELLLQQARGQHERMTQVQISPREVHAYSGIPVVRGPFSGSVFANFHEGYGKRSTSPPMPRQTPSEIRSRVDALSPLRRASPPTSLKVPSVLADRLSYDKDREEETKLLLQSQTQEETLNQSARLEGEKDQRWHRNLAKSEAGDTSGRFEMRTRGAGNRLGFTSACANQAATTGKEGFHIYVLSRSMPFATPASDTIASSQSALSPSPIHCPYSYNAVSHNTDSAAPYGDARAATITTVAKAATAAETAAAAAAKTAAAAAQTAAAQTAAAQTAAAAAACESGSPEAGFNLISDSRDVSRPRRPAASAGAGSTISGAFSAGHHRGQPRIRYGQQHAVAVGQRPLEQWLPISYRSIGAASGTTASSPEFASQKQKRQQKDSLHVHRPTYAESRWQQQQQQQQQQQLLRNKPHLKKHSERQVLIENDNQKQPWRRDDTLRERVDSKFFSSIENSTTHAESSAASRPSFSRLSFEEKRPTFATFDSNKIHLNNYDASQGLTRASFRPLGGSDLGRTFSPTSTTTPSVMAAQGTARLPRRRHHARDTEELLQDGVWFAGEEEEYSPAATVPWKRTDTIGVEDMDSLDRVRHTQGRNGAPLWGRNGGPPYENEAAAIFQLQLRVRGYRAGQRELQSILGAVGAYIRRLREQQQRDRQQWELLLFRRETEVQLVREQEEVLKQELQSQVETSRKEVDNLKKRITLQQQEMQELQEQLVRQRHANTGEGKEDEVRKEADVLKGKLLEAQAREQQVKEELSSLEKRLMKKLDESARDKEEAERARKEAQEECIKQKKLAEKLLQEQQQKSSDELHAAEDELRAAEDRLQMISKQLSGEKMQRVQVNAELQELCRQLSGERKRRVQCENELQLLLEAQSYAEVDEGESPESSIGKREQRSERLRKRHQFLQQQRYVQDAALFKATLEAHRAGIAPHVLQHDQAVQSQFEEQGGPGGRRDTSGIRPWRRAGLADEEGVVQKELELRGVKFLQRAGRGDANTRTLVASDQVSIDQDTLAAAKNTSDSIELPLPWWTGTRSESSSPRCTKESLTGCRGDECVDYTPLSVKLDTADGDSDTDASSTMAVDGPVANKKRILKANVSIASKSKVSLPQMSQLHTTNKKGNKDEGSNMASTADIASKAATLTADAVADSLHDMCNKITPDASAGSAQPPSGGGAVSKAVDSARDASSTKSTAPSLQSIL